MESRVNEVFNTLSKIKCKVEKKGRFNYVSWAEAWKEVKKLYPTANYKVYENDKGFPAFVSGEVGGFVKIGVTIEGLEHVEVYPILNNFNKAIPKTMMNVFDINNAIKRGMVKALAQHGLGLYVYEGEDLPEK